MLKPVKFPLHENRSYLVKYYSNGERFGMKVLAIDDKDAIRQVKNIDKNATDLEAELM